MAKITKKEEVKEEKVEKVEKKEIAPITDTFGNGDLNVLKDKINELISANK